MRRLLSLLFVAISAVAFAPGPAAGFVPRSFTVAAVGDVIIHSSIAAAARTADGYDFAPLLAQIEPWISDADFAICHLEVPLSPTDTGLAYQKGDEHPALFNAPREVADALAAAGFDTCTTAGNHAMDAGTAGIEGTLDVLDDAGLAHTGTSRTPDERGPAIYVVNGIVVGHIAYTIPTNLPRPWNEPWRVNIIDEPAILADAAAARAAGAEFVILSLHWGEEYESWIGAGQRSMAARLLASPDIDLILGSHSHVVSPVEWIDGELVAYGLGNHLSNIRGLPDNEKTGGEDGVILRLTVTENEPGRFAVTGIASTATWVDPVTKRVLPVIDTLGTGAGPAARSLRASLERTDARLALLGVEVPHTQEPWPALTCLGRRATLLGTPGDDVLIGTDHADVIAGRGGADTLWGMGGGDLVCGGDGDDVIVGNGGDDDLTGGAGDDLIVGGLGDDVLSGGEGDDLIGGGRGRDHAVSGPGADVISGGPGADALYGWTDAVSIAGDSADECRIAGLPVYCG